MMKAVTGQNSAASKYRVAVHAGMQQRDISRLRLSSNVMVVQKLLAKSKALWYSFFQCNLPRTVLHVSYLQKPCNWREVRGLCQA